MKIRLNEIPDEGRSYLFDRKSGELDAQLKELVGSHPYAIDMTIKPIGNAYEMRGTVKTTLSEVCSKCGYDFELPIDRKFNEIIFEEQDEHRKSQGVHGNQSVNFVGEGPSMIPVRGKVFDAADYAHEAVALAEPFYPMCGPNETCLHADEVKEIVERLEAQAELAVEEKPASPFSVLKDLGLSRKN
jgi:uncharacterized protein